MGKSRIFIAGVFIFCLLGAVTGAWAFTQSRAAAQTALLAKINAGCENPDAACAALLNQLEPGE
jgi:hypothetical protein